MNPLPLVSIVIPTYNRACDLEQALKTVQSQTYMNWEVLIVDNYSTDNTDEMINGLNDERIKLFKIHNNGVIAVSRNLGIQHALGEYVAFLDSDDWWAPRKLEESLKYLEAGEDVVYHDLFLVTKHSQRLHWRKAKVRDLNSPVFNDLVKNGNGLNNSSVVLRKGILQKIGGISENVALITMEDYDAWLRAAKITEKFKRIPKTLGYYWAGGGNASNASSTITALKSFEEVHADDIENLSAGNGFLWVNYSKGRAYYKLGSYDIAKETLKKIYREPPPLLMSIKILWMLLLIEIYHSKRH